LKSQSAPEARELQKLETMFLTLNVCLKQIRLVDAQDAAISEHLQEELKPSLKKAQTREQRALEQVSVAAASNALVHDSHRMECQRQEDQITTLRALTRVDENDTKNSLEDDDATLDLSESENYDELLHGDNSMDSTSKHLHSSFHASLKSFADSWTTFVHDQPERLSSTTHRVSESISSTKDRVAEKIVTFAVEQMGKSIPGC
jgi:hypothetical protein